MLPRTTATSSPRAAAASTTTAGSASDYSAEVAAAERAGRTVLQEGRWGAVHFTYYQPLAGEQRIGELIEMSALSQEIFALIRREAEQWDGTRPSRSLIAAAGWGLRWTALKVQFATLLGRGVGRSAVRPRASMFSRT